MHVLDSLKRFGVRKYVVPVWLEAPPAAFKRTRHARACPPAWDFFVNFTILGERRNLTNARARRRKRQRNERSSSRNRIVFESNRNF